jgi:hypothetical protein
MAGRGGFLTTPSTRQTTECFRFRGLTRRACPTRRGAGEVKARGDRMAPPCEGGGGSQEGGSYLFQLPAKWPAATSELQRARCARGVHVT